MKKLFASIVKFIGGIFTKEVIEVFDGEKKIVEAQKQVTNALAMFDVAAEAVENANSNLVNTISGVETQVKELMAKLSVAGSTKKKAEDAYDKNKKVIKKLKEFLCD